MKAKDLTEEQKQRLGRAANGVWDYIGADCLRCMEECGEKPLMPRSHVIEMVVDADRLADELGREKESDLLEFVQFAKYEEIVKALKPAFPFARYGW